MNVSICSKVAAITLLGAWAVSTTAHAQSLVGSSAEVLFKTAPRDATGPKCDIDFSLNELPVVAGTNGKGPFVRWESEWTNLVVRADLAEVALLKITSSDKMIETHANEKVSVHDVAEVKTDATRAWNEGVFYHAYSTHRTFMPPNDVFRWGRVGDKTMNGKGEFLIESIEYKFPPGTPDFDEDSSLSTALYFTCYSH